MANAYKKKENRHGQNCKQLIIIDKFVLAYNTGKHFTYFSPKCSSSKF